MTVVAGLLNAFAGDIIRRYELVSKGPLLDVCLGRQPVLGVTAFECADASEGDEEATVTLRSSHANLLRDGEVPAYDEGSIRGSQKLEIPEVTLDDFRSMSLALKLSALDRLVRDSQQDSIGEPETRTHSALGVRQT